MSLLILLVKTLATLVGMKAVAPSQMTDCAIKLQQRVETGVPTFVFYAMDGRTAGDIDAITKACYGDDCVPIGGSINTWRPTDPAERGRVIVRVTNARMAPLWIDLPTGQVAALWKADGKTNNHHNS